MNTVKAFHMKYLVFSDSHGMRTDLEQVLFSEKADAVIFLGDGLSDIEEVMHWFPGMGLVSVRGNCDFSRPFVTGERTVVTDGCTVIVTHGHAWGVKDGLYELEAHGRDCRATAVLYGHTHTKDLHMSDGMLVLNPGSIGYGGDYAVLTLENGQASAVLKSTMS